MGELLDQGNAAVLILLAGQNEDDNRQAEKIARAVIEQAATIARAASGDAHVRTRRDASRGCGRGPADGPEERSGRDVVCAELDGDRARSGEVRRRADAFRRLWSRSDDDALRRQGHHDGQSQPVPDVPDRPVFLHGQGGESRRRTCWCDGTGRRRPTRWPRPTKASRWPTDSWPTTSSFRRRPWARSRRRQGKASPRPGGSTPIPMGRPWWPAKRPSRWRTPPRATPVAAALDAATDSFAVRQTWLFGIGLAADRRRARRRRTVPRAAAVDLGLADCFWSAAIYRRFCTGGSLTEPCGGLPEDHRARAPGRSKKR